MKRALNREPQQRAEQTGLHFPARIEHRPIDGMNSTLEPPHEKSAIIRATDHLQLATDGDRRQKES